MKRECGVSGADLWKDTGPFHIGAALDRNGRGGDSRSGVMESISLYLFL